VIPWLGFACGHCRYCNSGRETLCEAQINTGYGMDGGYAEYAAAYERHVVKVPDGVDSLDAAPLSCAGVTVYKAVKSSGVGPSQLCAIFGVGGLGHLAVQYAKIQGATVVAVDLEDDKLEIARDLAPTTWSTPPSRIPQLRSRSWAAPTPRSLSRCLPGPSSRPSTRSPAAGR